MRGHALDREVTALSCLPFSFWGPSDESPVVKRLKIEQVRGTEDLGESFSEAFVADTLVRIGGKAQDAFFLLALRGAFHPGRKQGSEVL